MSAWFGKKQKAPSAAAGDPPSDEEVDYNESTQTSYITGDRRVDSHRVRLLIDSLATVSSESQDDPDALFELMVDRAIETVGAERGMLFRRGEDEGGPVLAVARALERDASGGKVAGKRLPKGGSFSSEAVLRVLEGGTGEYHSGNDSGDFDPSQSMIQLDIRSLMCVPLDMQAEGRGALYVDARASENPFDRGDLRFFQAFANMLEIVWRQRQALTERVQAVRMARDLQLAQQIQTGLLPAESIRSPNYSACGRVIAAEEAGGDYYDYFGVPGGRLAVAVGDVSGHGAGPALIMAGARAYLRSACQSIEAPGDVLSLLNHHLVADTDDDKFMSMFLGMLDPDAHSFHWSNAGHPPPIVVRAEGGETLQCQTTGMALGIDEESAYGQGEMVELEPGDTVVMVTDGIVELRRGGDDQYGTERLIGSVRTHASLPAEELLEAIFSDALNWAGSVHPGQDDLTVAVLRRDS